MQCAGGRKCVAEVWRWAVGVRGHVRNKPRKVTVSGPQSRQAPGGHRRTHLDGGTCVQEQRGRSVSDPFGVQPMQKTKIVHMATNFREQVRDKFAGLAAGAELPEWFHQLLLSDLAEVSEAYAGEVDVLSVSSRQFGFAVEGIDVAGPALHEDEDDAFGAGSQHGQPGRAGGRLTRLFGGSDPRQKCLECQ